MWGFYSKTSKYVVDPKSELGLFNISGGLAAVIDNDRHMPSDKIQINIYGMEHFDLTIKYKLDLYTPPANPEKLTDDVVAIRTNSSSYYLLKVANYSEVQFSAIIRGFNEVSKLLKLKPRPLLLYKGREYTQATLSSTPLVLKYKQHRLVMPVFDDIFPLFYIGVIRCLNDLVPEGLDEEWYHRLTNLCRLVYSCKFTQSGGEVPSDRPLREFCRGYISAYRLIEKNTAMSCVVTASGFSIKIDIKSR